jgi:colanic acid biosynthesis glycosyl transferase WcaI
VRILLVQRYFWPDVGVAASVLRAVAAHLAEEGHRVTVLSAMPSYNEAYSGEPPPRRETLDGHQVIRLRPPLERKRSLFGRTWSMGTFSAMVAAHLLLRGRRYDVIYTSSTPPVVLTAVVRWVTQLIRRPYVYHCQDVHPEAGLLAGVLKEGRGTRAMARADRANVRRAAAVVVLSRDMVHTLEARGLDCRHVVVINNFFVDYEAPLSGDLPADLAKPDGVFRVLFAGNLGLLQGLGTVLEAARRVDGGIQFAFVGAGAGEASLQEEAGSLSGDAVVLFPQQPLPVVAEMMKQADLGLITLAPGVYRVAYPSKTMAYLEAGCPLLATVEEESELAAFIREENLGLVCPPGDPDALAGVVVEAQRRGRDPTERARVREVGQRRFGRRRTLDEWSHVFRSAGSEGRKAPTG